MKFKAILLCLFFALMLILPSPSDTQPRKESTPTIEPARVYKVAILPFMIHSQENLDYLQEGIYNMLTSRITVEDRIEVLQRSIVERALYEVRPTRLDESSATKIGMKIGADFVVVGSITKVGDYISLDARLINVTGEKPPLSVFTQHKGIDDVMVKIGEFAQDIGYKILGRRTMADRLGEPKRGGMIERFDRGSVDFKKSQTFDFEIKGLDIGDVDGDKKNEVVFMDTHHLYIFKYDGEKLRLFQKIDAGNEHNFLTLDVSDLNRNGYAEIIVTSVVEDEPRSFILEYEEGKFKKITEKAGWFFRVLDHPKEGPILLAQKRGSDGLPVDPIYRMVWKKKSFERERKMNFPKGTMIFGTALGNIRSKATADLLVLDDFESLRMVSSDAKELWKSRVNYGGTANFYETKKHRGDNLDRYPPPFRVYIPGRVVIKDLDGDGLSEVMVNKNSVSGLRLLERVRSFDRGEIHNLVWYENALDTNWKTKEIEGYISDFQVKDSDNDGEPELVVAVIDFGGPAARTGTSKIYFYKLF